MISLHYTSHTKAYNTIYAACNIVEAIYSFTHNNHVTAYKRVQMETKLKYNVKELYNIASNVIIPSR